MEDEQIKHMVNRFLMWRLPENFSPDNGIGFKPTFNDSPQAMKALGLSEPMKRNPVGTNLFDATQAEAMVRHMVEEMRVPEDGRASALEEAAIMAERFGKHHEVAPIIAGWIRHLKTDPDAGKRTADAPL